MKNLLSGNEDFEKNSKEKEIVEHFSEMVKKHSLQFLPGLSLLDDLINFKTDLNKKRVSSFMENFYERIRSEFGADFNFKNLETEGFSDLFQLVLQKVENTKSEFKKERYRDILLLKVKINSDHLLFMKFVELLDKVNEVQIILIKEMAENDRFALGVGLHKGYTIMEAYLSRYTNEVNVTGKSLNSYATKDNNGEIEFYLLELVSLGLIKEIPQKITHSGTSSPKYVVTDICRKFLTFIIKK